MCSVHLSVWIWMPFEMVLPVTWMTHLQFCIGWLKSFDINSPETHQWDFFRHISFLLCVCVWMHTSQSARQFIHMRCVWCRHVSWVHSATFSCTNWTKWERNQTELCINIMSCINCMQCANDIFTGNEYYRWMKWNAKHNMAFRSISKCLYGLCGDCQLMQMQTSIILTRNMILPYIFCSLIWSSWLCVCCFLLLLLLNYIEWKWLLFTEFSRLGCHYASRFKSINPFVHSFRLKFCILVNCIVWLWWWLPKRCMYLCTYKCASTPAQTQHINETKLIAWNMWEMLWARARARARARSML